MAETNKTKTAAEKMQTMTLIGAASGVTLALFFTFGENSLLDVQPWIALALSLIHI